MRPLQLRSRLLVLTLGTALLLLLLGGAAWFFALGPAAGLVEPELLPALLALLALLAFALPALLALAAARRIGVHIAATEAAFAEASELGRAREAALRGAERAKDEFLATLSHELRNPIGALANAVHILKSPASRPQAIAQATAVVARQVQQMARLVEDLLDITRVTRGKLSLSRRPLDLSALVGRTVEALRAAGRLERHQLALELEPVWVHGDEARLEQIVSNLLGNAVKYTPPGGGIVVGVRRERDTALLRVRDTGIGMPLELTARVFDLFVQGERTDERRGGGLGIGLALVKHLAELHGGMAYAASTGPDQGSVFTVTLPVTEARPAQAEPPASAGARRCHRILVIEDNEDARRTLSTALEMDGHQVYEAADGELGLERAAEIKPDVALIDIGLPGLSGYEVAQKLRGLPAREGLVLIAITGRGQADSLRLAREAGFDQYVTKPIAPDRLARLMDAALLAKAGAAARASPK